MSSASARLEPLRRRDDLRRRLRAHFHAAGYLEVETPVRVAAPAPEEHIDAIVSGDRFLRTSPELDMKRLLAAGAAKIFQLGPCCRAGEHGRRHREEFTMLEWYAAGADYHDLRRFTRDLLRAALGDTLTYRGTTVDLRGDWPVIAVADAFRKFAGVDVRQALAADTFEVLLVERVEPALPADRPVFLTDYPTELAALARRRTDDPTVAERWELYLGGLELANAFSELTDPTEQRARFLAANAYRAAHGRQPYPLDEAFLAALAAMPPAAGCALGFDRLVMLATDTADIADTRWE